MAGRSGTRTTAGPLALVALAVTSWLLRAWPVLTCGPMCRPIEFDEGTYSATGALLARGVVPYRDFFLAHPPGIALVLAPANLVLEPRNAFAANVLLMATAGALSVALVALIVRPVAGWTGAIAGAAVLALTPQVAQLDQGLRIEPLLTLLLLAAAFVWLRPGEPGRTGVVRRSIWTGVAFGLALVTKLAAPVLVPALWATRRDRGGSRALLIAGSSALATFLLVCGPFVVLGGSRVTTQALGYQWTRAAEGQPPWSGGRWSELLLGRPAGWMLLPTVAAAVGSAVWLGRPASRTDQSMFALVWAGTTLAALLTVPVFFSGYGALLAPPAAIALGCALPSLVGDARPAGATRVLAVVAVLAAAVTGLLSARLTAAWTVQVREAAWDDFRMAATGRPGICTFGFRAPTEGRPDRSAWLVALDMVPDPDGRHSIPTMLGTGTDPAARERVLRTCDTVIGLRDDLDQLGADQEWFLASYRPDRTTAPALLSPAPTIWVRSP